MAKKRDGSMSQAIRDAISKLGKKAKPADIVAECAAQGVEVAPGLVYQVRAKEGGRRGRRRGRRRAAAEEAAPASSARRGTGNVSFKDVLAAKEFVKSCGGSVSQARKALEAFEVLV